MLNRRVSVLRTKVPTSILDRTIDLTLPVCDIRAFELVLDIVSKLCAWNVAVPPAFSMYS